MVKLVVADDEERVCRLIVALGNWEELGIQVVGTAANGVQALELIQKEKTDILITDIRMPGIGGLELIEKVRAVSPDIKIMIISGYANFEYAQNALKQGVSDYLLKPINKDALNEALAKMVAQIEAERKATLAFQDFQNERREEMLKFRKMLFHDLKYDHSLQLTENILKEKYYLNIHTGVFQVIAVKQDTTADGNPPELIWNKMEEIMLRELMKECYELVLAADGEYLYGILNYPVRNTEKIRKAVRSSFNQMLARNDYLGKTSLSLGLGTAVREASEIADSYVEAGNVLADRILEGSGKILEADGSGEVLFEKKLVDKFARNLGTALQTLDVEAIRTSVGELYQEIMNTPGVHGWEIMETAAQCGSMFIMRLDIPDKTELQQEFQKNCDSCKTVNMLFEYLLDFMTERIRRMLAAREEDSIRPVRLAKQYIHNHYQEQITLEEVSEYVGLTPAYFSVLFKKETEIGFAKYLSNERIEGAKDLLRETTFSVADICRKVGYNDAKHFTRLFEKSVGVNRRCTGNYMDNIREFVKEQKKKFRYLDVRLKVYLVALCVTAMFLVLCLDRSWLFPEGFWKVVLVFMPLAMLGIGYLWIGKPYTRILNQVERFSDGYITLSDINDLDVSVAPELERMVRHMNKVVTSARTLDMSKRQAQYRALQNQINPHFLYNTLEGIRSEAIIAGLDNLADMTEALAIFFRYTISKVENLVTIEEELENCATYFKIQQYRFGSRIHLEIEQDEEDWEDILHCMIPKLTLQPILENSIIHGIELKLEEGVARISISRTQSRLLVRVSDNGVGMNRETLEKLNAKLGSKEEEVKNSTRPENERGGVALVNVNNRIHLLFGEEYGMHVYSLENVGTTVEMSIPVIYNENELKLRKKQI